MFNGYLIRGEDHRFKEPELESVLVRKVYVAEIKDGSVTWTYMNGILRNVKSVVNVQMAVERMGKATVHKIHSYACKIDFWLRRNFKIPLVNLCAKLGHVKRIQILFGVA